MTVTCGKTTTMGKGILWTGLEKVFVQGVSFVQGAVLARLLCPEDFGLTAMLGLFFCLAGIFIDSGFGVALMQNREFTRRDERKVLLFNLGVAAALYAVLFFAAPGIAVFYREPRLVAITRVFALTLVLNAPCGIANARLQRTERFGAMSRANMFVSLLVAVCAVSLAWCGMGVWTLVGAGVLWAALRTAVMWLLARGIAAPGADAAQDSFAALLRYGWKLAVSYLLSTVYRNVIPLVIGKLQTPTAVGLYARASSWSTLPGNIVSEMIGRVSFPKMAGAKDSPAEFRRLKNRSAWLGMALLLPALVVLWIFARPIVLFVFGSQWLECVPYLRILVIGMILWPLSTVGATALGAGGRSDLVLKADLVRRPAGVAVLLIGCPFGIEGLCWAKVSADLVDWLVVSAFVHKATGAPFWKETFSL